MTLQSTTLFGMLHERLDWLAQRQQVLSQNIANADTAGYKARDLKALDFRQTLKNAESKLDLMRTDERHAYGTTSGTSYHVQEDPTVSENSLSGNNVLLEEQISKVSKNSTDYQLATRIFSKYKAMHRMAVTGRSN